MLLGKLSIIILLFSNLAFGEKFQSAECIRAEFKTEVKNKGKFFGLVTNELKIATKECIIDIDYKNILDTQWQIDICREPVHIKVTSKGQQTFYKRAKKCGKSNQTDSFFL